MQQTRACIVIGSPSRNFWIGRNLGFYQHVEGGPTAFTPEIESFYMLLVRSLPIFSITSLKQHM